MNLEEYKNDKIIIIPHPNPDVDSIISGFLLEKLLKIKGFNAKFIIPVQEINKETESLCKKYGVDPNEYMGVIQDDVYIILVDHYKTNYDNKIIAIIDHHPTIEKVECDNYINEESSSTAMIIYDLDPQVFNKNDEKLVVFANSIDTDSFTSTKTIEKDKNWSIKKCEENGYNYQEISEDSIKLTDITDIKKAVINGEKEYIYNSKRVKSSYIRVGHMSEEMLNGCINALRKRVKEENLVLWVFIVHYMKGLKSTAYLISDNNIKSIKYKIIVSRGKTVMPHIEKEILNPKFEKRRD